MGKARQFSLQVRMEANLVRKVPQPGAGRPLACRTAKFTAERSPASARRRVPAQCFQSTLTTDHSKEHKGPSHPVKATVDPVTRFQLGNAASLGRQLP